MVTSPDMPPTSRCAFFDHPCLSVFFALTLAPPYSLSEPSVKPRMKYC